MSIKCSGVASRSFIIGSRLCPPAMTRASGPSFCSDAIALSTLVARSYSNAAGVCMSVARREALAWLADVLAVLVLHRGVRTDDRRPGHQLRPRLADLRVELPCRQASPLDVPQCGACGVPDGDRRFAAEPCERERPLRVD